MLVITNLQLQREIDLKEQQKIYILSLHRKEYTKRKEEA